MSKPKRTLNVISTRSCVDRLVLLRASIADSINAEQTTILYTEGMPGNQVYSVTENLHGSPTYLHTRSDPDEVLGLVLAHQSSQPHYKKVHVLIGKSVSYEPTASNVSFGGLTIPFVADPRLSEALKLADIVTVCNVE